MSFWERLSHGFRPSQALLQEHTWTKLRKAEEKMHRDQIRFVDDSAMGPDTIARTPNEIALDKASDLLKLPKHLIENIDSINTSVNEDCITIDISFAQQKVSNKAYLFGSDGSTTIIETKPDMRNFIDERYLSLSSYVDYSRPAAARIINSLEEAYANEEYSKVTRLAHELKSLRTDSLGDFSDVTNLDLYLEDDIHLANELITRMLDDVTDCKYAEALITSRQLKKLQKQEGEN